MNQEIYLIECANEPIDLSKKSIEYAPAGTHKIFAKLNHEPGSIDAVIEAEAAEILNAKLQAWLEEAESGKVSRPFIDFDHEGKIAAALPKRFYWDNGLRLEVEWTEAGRQAIEGRNYSYFSPEVFMDRKTGKIVGLPPIGPIGALTNTPAFQTIQRLAAASPNLTNKTNQMDIKELQDKLDAANGKLAVLEADLTKLQASFAESETKAKGFSEELEKVTAERDELNNTNAKLQASAEEIRKEKISAQIEAKGIKEENREAVLAACLTQEDDGAKLLAAYEAPRSGGIPPLDKNKAIKDEPKATGLARVAAAFSTSDK
jgi:hypothetical protein